LVFAQSNAQFDLHSPAQAHQTNSTFQLLHRHGPNGHETNSVPETTHETTFPDSIRGTMDLSGEKWASVFLEADSITIADHASTSVISRLKADDDLRSRLPRGDHAEYMFWGGIGRPDWLAARGDGPTVNGMPTAGTQLPFSLHAQGIHRLVWHNATLQCPGLCPDSGRPSTTHLDDPFGDTELQRLSYIELETNGGTLDGQGSIWEWVAGGSSLNLGLAGSMRLQDASLKGHCPAASCPDPGGKTFLAQGNLTLSDLVVDGQRLHTQLAGDFARAAFDESPVPTFLTPGVVAGAAVAVGAVVVVWFLFARSARPPVLQSARRKQLFDAIRDHPGLSGQELRRHLGWPWGTMRFHLKRLDEEGLVMRQRDGRTVRFFENHGRYESTWRRVAPMREEDVRRLHDWLKTQTGAHQARIAETTAEWGWTRARTLRRLARLQTADLVATHREGRRLVYVATRESQSGAPPV
jgi:predicted transcriptional regulator